MKWLLLSVALMASPAFAQAPPKYTIDDVRALHDLLENRPPGASVKLGGLDFMEVTEALAGQIIELHDKPHYICFDFNLAINGQIDDETKKIIREFLDDAVNKIKEGCRLALPPQEPPK